MSRRRYNATAVPIRHADRVRLDAICQHDRRSIVETLAVLLEQAAAARGILIEENDEHGKSKRSRGRRTAQAAGDAG